MDPGAEIVRTAPVEVRTVSPEKIAVVDGAPAPFKTTLPVDFRTAELSAASNETEEQTIASENTTPARSWTGRMPFTSEGYNSPAMLALR